LEEIRENQMAESRTIAALRRIAVRLHDDTRASRVTIRVDCASLGLEIETVAVESRDESARALEGQRTPNARESAAVRWLCANRRTFVMDDCLNPWDPEVAPEHYVINLYGIRSEMLSGIFRGETLVGVVSVHYTKGTRSWRDEEVGMIEAACREVLAVIDGHENI
jgi:GAF domain-containing protein